MLSSSPCWFPFCTTLLFASSCQTIVLLIMSCYCFPLHIMLLSSFLSCCSPLHTTLLFSFSHHTTPLLFTPHCCYPLCTATAVGVLSFVEESCITPYIHSCKNWKWSRVENWKLVFFGKYFSLCLFSFFIFFNLISFIPFFFYKMTFGLWCRACYKLFWKRT
jgi:hypothetical protein